jgi:hypothetical protein
MPVNPLNRNEMSVQKVPAGLFAGSGRRVKVMTLMEQETLLNSKGNPWASLKDSFAAARDRQIDDVHEDAAIQEAWRGAIEQAHRDNYAHLIDTLVKLSSRA